MCLWMWTGILSHRVRSRGHRTTTSTLATLPAVVGPQRALELLLTGRQLHGAEALSLGLCDRLASVDQLRAEAHALAAEIAGSAPLAVRSIRATLRSSIVERIGNATERES